ncbi:MAG: hypothetical protein LUC45_07320 [Paraprevotella sp.]|nr:hypothetical protein [Paraprevotella sp.]
MDTRDLAGCRVRLIATTREGSIWISTEGTLFRFGTDGRLLRRYLTRNGKQPTSISGFCEGRNGEVVMAFAGGRVYRWDTKKDVLQAFPCAMRHANPGAIVQDRTQDYYWMGTWGDGIVRFDPHAAPDSMWVYQERLSDVPGENRVIYLAQDAVSHRIWATTSVGLSVFDVTDGRPAVSGTGCGLASSSVMLNDIICDRNGNLWVSAFDTPSFILHFQDDAPEVFALPSLHRETPYRPAVMTLCDSGDGILWFFQERTGVFLYDLKTGKTVSHHDLASTRRLPLPWVKVMAESRDPRSVWLSPEFALSVYRLKRDGMRIGLQDEIDLSAYPAHQAVTTLLESDDGQLLYIGTLKGILVYDLKRKRVVRDTDWGHVTQMISSPDGTIWAATYNRGLYALSPQERTSRYPLRQALSCLARTSDGLLWLGSDEGDSLSFDPHGRTLRNYDRICHLNGDMVNRVASDEFNHIWIGTNQKVIEFNPRNGSFRTYSTSDGSFRLWRFIPTSFCWGKDGRLYFGGIPGICRFTPSNALDREAAPARTVITDIRVNGRSLFFDDATSVSSDKEVCLGPSDRQLVISFSSLNPRLAHKIRYAYRMKGIHEGWQYTEEGQHTAVYSHLPKG